MISSHGRETCDGVSGDKTIAPVGVDIGLQTAFRLLFIGQNDVTCARHVAKDLLSCIVIMR
jgi:hypothetical protein